MFCGSYPGYELRPFMIRHPTAHISLSTNNRVSGLKNAKNRVKPKKLENEEACVLTELPIKYCTI